MEVVFAAADEPDLVAVKAGVNSIANISNSIFHAVKIKKKVFLGCHLEVLLLEGPRLRRLVVAREGFEPPTSGSKARRSTAELSGKKS